MAKPVFSFPKILRPQGAVVPARYFVDFILRLPRLEILKPILDLILISVGAAWAWVVSYGQVTHPGSPLPFLIAVVVARTLIYFTLKLHRTSWLHVSRFEVMWLVMSALVGAPMIALLLWVLPDPFTLNKLTRPEIILSTEAAFYLLLLFGVRITARALAHSKRPHNLRRILIIGAGQKGRSLAYQIQETGNSYQAVGFLDDDAAKQKRSFRGLKVLGRISDLRDVVLREDVQEVVVAIDALAPEHLRQILTDGEQSAIPVRILPPLRELIGVRPDLKAVREVRMEDLLPRPEVEFDTAEVSAYLKGRTVLVTGGGGSIGSELCRQALRAGAERLLVLGRGENSVFEALQDLSDLKVSGEFNHSCEIIPIICDVRDRVALKQTFERYHPEVVFHAAAHKHVPLMEQYPCEAVKNNVLGTLNVVELASQGHVKRLVLVSTDKAVAPTSVMGATKRITEMIIQAHRMRKDFNIVCVRFGNVLGSRGSVVPTMTRQIQRRMPVTLTDPEMVRFFMTIPEAVQLILQAGAVGGHGEVFVLDMGRPVRILDLAHDLIKLHGLVPEQDIQINIIGKRPGEKMYEELLTVKESVSAEKRGPFYVAATQPFDRDEFLHQVRLLIRGGEEGKEEEVKRLLCQLVPEFCQPALPNKQPLQIVEHVINQAMVIA
ncbi:UDP-N-acetyl-alpha-D-glucosamine C6 dehydratase [Abditibacteriota bacterium]|nr:UDP-N-acetyl-alpha-D-glucosamine C6 dehydratase [Abditibacteriota bacterium]